VPRRFSIEVPGAAIARPKKSRKVSNHKSVTAAQLETLGATRLAELLAELSQEHPSLKRRLAYELAGAAGTDGIAADIRHRLTALARAKTFIDWQGCRAFAKDLDLLRRTILEKVAAERPALALELLWQFMALAGSTFERVDDSNGRVSAVFRTACAELGTVAVKGSLDPIPLADQVFAAVTTNLYGEYDPLVEAAFPALGARGSQHLKRRLTAALKHPAGKDPDGSGAQGLKSALQDLADQEGDVDAFLAQESESARKIPQVAAQIGQRLLAAGRAQEAWEVLQKAKPRQNAPSREELEEDLVCGAEELGGSDWADVWVEALLATDHFPEAQRFRWRRFEQALHAASVRAYLQALPERERRAAERRAVQSVLTFRHFATALQFLIGWPDLAAAARLVLDRRDELDGNLYFLLDPAAKTLEGQSPHVAILLYRAMIEDTLNGAKSSRYAHAARHLVECQSLSLKLQKQNDIESHDAFLAKIKARHARKTGFWSRVAKGEPVWDED
jgi:hypothetical protein